MERTAATGQAHACLTCVDLENGLRKFSEAVLSKQLSHFAALIRDDMREALETRSKEVHARLPLEAAAPPRESPLNCEQQEGQGLDLPLTLSDMERPAGGSSWEDKQENASNGKSLGEHAKTGDSYPLLASENTRSTESAKTNSWEIALAKTGNSSRVVSYESSEAITTSVVARSWDVGRRAVLNELQRDVDRTTTSLLSKDVASTRGYCSRLLASAVISSFFENLVTIVVLANAVYMGISSDSMARNNISLSDAPLGYRVMDNVFLGFFLVEMILRFQVFRCDLFRFSTASGRPNYDFAWNVFDTVIVGLGVLEFALRQGTEGTHLRRAILLRICRILRLFRVIRVIRFFRVVRDLRVILLSLYGSFPRFLWAVIAFASLTYFWAIYFTDVVAAHLADDHQTLPSDSHLIKYFGTLSTSMFSLIKVIFGGVDWGEVSDALSTLDSWQFALYPFIAYVAFAVIAVLNVIGGVFLDTAMVIAKKERELFLVRSAHSVLKEVEMTQKGMITWPQFENALENEDVKNFFQQIDIDISDAKHLFELLDKSQDGLISGDEFLKGCARLHGPAKALDLQLLAHENRLHFQRLEKFIIGAPAGSPARIPSPVLLESGSRTEDGRTKVTQVVSIPIPGTLPQHADSS